MWYKFFLSVLLLCNVCYADISLKDEYNECEPIVVTCEVEQDNEFTVFDWKYDPVLENGIVQVDKKTLHIWAKPGNYDIDCTVVVPNVTVITTVVRDPQHPDDISKAKLVDKQVINGISVERYKKVLKVKSSTDVTPEPDDEEEDIVPIPEKEDPVPATGFHVIIIEETLDRTKLSKEQLLTLKSSKVKGLTQKYGGTFKQVDDDSVYTHSDSDLQKVINKIKKDGKPLPWLIISNDQSWYDGPVLPLDQTLDLIETYKPR